MKKISFFLAAVAATMFAISCNKVEDSKSAEQPAGEPVQMIVDVQGDMLTKAYTEEQAYETNTNVVQILVFDQDGRLNAYKNAGSVTSGIVITTTAGTKTVWAVVNGPNLESNVQWESDLKQTVISLGDNSLDASKGFVMTGKVSANVTNAGNATAAITVSRLAARIALNSIKNSLPVAYGALDIKNVFLANIVGNIRLDGEFHSEKLWYNKMGRKDGATASSEIIDGGTYTASFPSLTFNAINEQPAHGVTYDGSIPNLLYCYKNDATAEVNTWGTWSERKTKLIITAAVAGVTYYYAVVIPSVERNKAYTVDVEITGLGSLDPDKPVEKGDVTSNVTVADWIPGNSISEII